MSYLIVDIDGTLTTTGDAPRHDFIDWLKSQVQDMNEEVIIVSARPIPHNLKLFLAVQCAARAGPPQRLQRDAWTKCGVEFQEIQV